MQVVSIKPELNESNQLELVMVVAGDTRDRAIDLVRRMEESPEFRNARVRTEAVGTGGDVPEGKIKVEINALYLPQVRQPQQPQQRGAP